MRTVMCLQPEQTRTPRRRRPISLRSPLSLLLGSGSGAQSPSPGVPKEPSDTLTGDSPWPGTMARCSSDSRSPRAGFGGDRHGPTRSGHMCWGEAEGRGCQLGSPTSSCGRRAAGRRHSGRGSGHTWRSPGPSQGRGQAKDALGWTAPHPQPRPLPLVAGERGNLMPGVPRSPKMPLRLYWGLRPSLLPQTEQESTLSPPLSHQGPRPGHARRAFCRLPLSS